jgi:hypothetical protein
MRKQLTSTSVRSHPSCLEGLPEVLVTCNRRQWTDGFCRQSHPYLQTGESSDFSGMPELVTSWTM